MSLLKAENLEHSYQDGTKKNKVLKGINVEFENGKFYAILGESGSGKTTLLSLLSGLDSIQSGDIYFNDKSIKKIGYDNYRLKCVNIIFQAYNLIPYMTAVENVEVAIDIMKVKVPNKRALALKVLNDLGISHDTAMRTVLRLSGGEQQRTAIARCLVGDIPLILADEPTGNLDEDTEMKIIEIFKELTKKDKCVIVVTHSKRIAANADVIYKIKSGLIEKIS